MAITVMQRYEMKYLLDARQTNYLRRMLKGYMQVDDYGLTSIASLYYDTADARLIRASLEGQKFKEKLRLRSYGLATGQSPVYLELKRKYDGIVYKRRVQSTIMDVDAFFCGSDALGEGRIQQELTYFRDFHKNLIPNCLIIYDRVAYFEPGGDLRLTIDYKPRYRMEDLSLTKSMEGELLLDKGWSILEVKVQGAMPLWLSEILNKGKIYKNSFSKYGEAYRREQQKQNEKTIIFITPKLLQVA